MSAPAVSVRCPTCGADLRVFLASAPPTQWFPCPHCANPVPVVVPRDPPPLYTWEVLPGLYPALPPPRRPRVRLRRVAQAALIGVAALALVLAGVLGFLGAEASAPGSYLVTGTVGAETAGGGTVPALGASVVLTTEGGQRLVESLPASGAFSFSGVPVGGISINITLAGYGPVTVVTFASTIYNAGTTDLAVTLLRGGPSNGTTVALSPFPDLESLLASIGSGVALLAIVAALGVVTAVITGRSNRPAVGVVGGAAGLLSPLALYFLALGGAFPDVIAGAALLGGLGAFATTSRAIEIFQVGPESRIA